MTRITKIIFILLIVVGTFYLVLPSPVDFPLLPGSIKSTEPGDTVQIANVSAYYTDMPRNEVVDFYFNYFSKSPFRNIPLITYKVNHPPERIREVLRDTQQSTFVEEIIHPFKDSVFVNGFEWDNDPFTSPNRRIKNILIVNGKTYQFKITLYYQASNVFIRLLIFYLTIFSAYLIYKETQKILKKYFCN
jgi:hypothetical protein